MRTPHGGGQRNRRQSDATEPSETGTVGTVEHCSCGLAGLLATALVFVSLYPVLVALTRPLYLLSSTALVFILLSIWLGTWLLLELAWEWRAGRLTVDT